MRSLIKTSAYLLGLALITHAPLSLASSNISTQEKRNIQNFVEHSLSSRYQAAPHVGIIVRSLDSGEIIYQKNAEKLMVPASVQKLLTAIAALVYLGPNLTFSTSLLTDATNIHNGVIDGNLVVKFSGDPSLRAADLSQLFRQLAAQGIHQINASIFVDNDDYNSAPYGPGWVKKDFMYHYAAPLNAIIINENSFNLTLRPSQVNQRAQVTSNLPPNAAHFQNSLVTTNARRSCSVAIESDQHNNYRVSGCLVKSWGVQTSLLAVKDPNSYAKSLVHLSLQQNHIRFNGTIKMHHDPAAQKTLVVHQSAPLKELIIRMLKKSDNIFANTLLKKIGQLYFHTAGTWENGVQAVKDILSEHAHINFNNSVILDGAGLSPYNLITPNQLSALLHYAYHDQKVAPYLLTALPLAGVDGTLKHRMRSLTPHFQLRGKTGTLQSVSALAGYLVTSKNHRLSFVIMVNGYKGRCYPYTHLQDQICQYLAHNA